MKGTTFPDRAPLPPTPLHPHLPEGSLAATLKSLKAHWVSSLLFLFVFSLFLFFCAVAKTPAATQPPVKVESRSVCAQKSLVYCLGSIPDIPPCPTTSAPPPPPPAVPVSIPHNYTGTQIKCHFFYFFLLSASILPVSLSSSFAETHWRTWAVRTYLDVSGGAGEVGGEKSILLFFFFLKHKAMLNLSNDGRAGLQGGAAAASRCCVLF